MDEKSNWPPEILEALEAIRPGEPAPDGPALAPAIEALKKSPELAHRAEQIRQWDSHLEEALGDVEVPPGLAQRILDRLEQAEPPPSPAAPTTTRRRPLWWATAAIAGLAAAVVLAVVFLSPEPPLTADMLQNLAQEQFVVSLDSGEERGKLVTEVSPPDEFPFPRDLLNDPGTRWRGLPNFGGHEGVAYDLLAFTGKQATVYVVRCQATGLPPAPPAVAAKGTRGLALAAWQEGDLVYVVVVEGGQGVYQFLILSNAPIA